MGGEIWCGEDDAHLAVAETVEAADRTGQLRGILDAVRSHRVTDDFSRRWSYARDDFERKLYRNETRSASVSSSSPTPSRDSLREVTRTDIDTVLAPLQAHPRYNAIAALRSLFRLAKRRGHVFTRPPRTPPPHAGARLGDLAPP